MDLELKDILKKIARGNKRITALTGAGISAESNIPTFRGPEGYWTVGSREYHPQEMATLYMFQTQPEEVWRWYLYRYGVCRSARPNPGHRALVEMEHMFQDRFTLITQNVDGLHLRAGNSPDKTFQIHGNIFFMRCSRPCSETLYPVPENMRGKQKDEPLTDADRALIRCPACGDYARPHVLWFDEAYNEEYYKFHSSQKVAAETELLLIVGTSGATNLPNQVAWVVSQAGGCIIDINIEPNPFTRMALDSGRGFFIQKPSGTALPEILKVMKKAIG